MTNSKKPPPFLINQEQVKVVWILKMELIGNLELSFDKHLMSRHFNKRSKIVFHVCRSTTRVTINKLKLKHLFETLSYLWSLLIEVKMIEVTKAMAQIPTIL